MVLLLLQFIHVTSRHHPLLVVNVFPPALLVPVPLAFQLPFLVSTSFHSSNLCLQLVQCSPQDTILQYSGSFFPPLPCSTSFDYSLLLPFLISRVLPASAYFLSILACFIFRLLSSLFVSIWKLAHAPFSLLQYCNCHSSIHVFVSLIFFSNPNRCAGL